MSRSHQKPFERVQMPRGKGSAFLLLSPWRENRGSRVASPWMHVAAVRGRDGAVVVSRDADGRPFHGLEWRRTNAARGRCVALGALKRFSPLHRPWMPSKAAVGRAGRCQGDGREDLWGDRCALGPLGRRGGDGSREAGRVPLPFPAFMWRTRLCTLELLVNNHTRVERCRDFLGGAVLIIRHSVFIELPSIIFFKKKLHIAGLDIFLKSDYPVTVFLCMLRDKCIALLAKIILITLINTWLQIS